MRTRSRRSGKAWATYAEDLPAPGYDGAFAGRYAQNHDPELGLSGKGTPIGGIWKG